MQPVAAHGLCLCLYAGHTGRLRKQLWAGLAGQWQQNYGDGGTLYPPSSGLVPLYPPSQRCGLCQNFKHEVWGSYKFVLPTYEKVPTRLWQAYSCGPQEPYIRCSWTSAPAGEYHWTICVLWQCSLVSNYFDHWLFVFVPFFASTLLVTERNF